MVLYSTFLISQMQNIYLAQNFSSTVTFPSGWIRDDAWHFLRGMSIIILYFPSSALSGSVVCVFTHLAVIHRLMMVMMMVVVSYSPEYVHARVPTGKSHHRASFLYTRAVAPPPLVYFHGRVTRVHWERWNEHARLKSKCYDLRFDILQYFITFKRNV